jgi:hypothetical protein
VVFLWFHHTGAIFETAAARGNSSGGFGFTLGLAVLGGTAFVMWLLSKGGRALAQRSIEAGVPSLWAAIHGAKVGLPYAAVCLVAAAAGRLTISVPSNAIVAGPVTVHPSYVSAFLWPLALASAAGFGGGLRAARGRGDLVEHAVERRVRAAVAGGWRMFAVGLALSFGGLLVLAVIHPGDTRAYFDAVFRRGALPGITLVSLTALLVPNLAAWVLFPSMGSCVTLAGKTSQCLLSYGHFPAGGPGRELGGVVGRLAPSVQTNAPSWYLLFLLVPVLAVVVGGMRAADRGSASSRTEAAALGAGAGLVFAGLCSGLVFLGSISGLVMNLAATSAGSGFRLGPDPVPSIALALVWGVIGGAAGAVVRGPSPSGAGLTDC